MQLKSGRGTSEKGTWSEVEATYLHFFFKMQRSASRLGPKNKHVLHNKVGLFRYGDEVAHMGVT